MPVTVTVVLSAVSRCGLEPPSLSGAPLSLSGPGARPPPEPGRPLGAVSPGRPASGAHWQWQPERPPQTSESDARGRRRGQVRSGQVRCPAEAQDHESHRAASATSEATSLESNYARIIRDGTAEPLATTNVAENHSNCAASSQLVHKGITEGPLLQLRKSRNLFTGP